jgi:hypothetical protein
MKDIVTYFEELTGFKATQEQIEILETLTNDNIKNLIICCGRGFSKTLLASIITLWYSEKSLESNPIKIMLVSAQDTMWKYVNSYFTTKTLRENLIKKGLYTEIPVEGYQLKNATEVFTKPPTNKVRSNRTDILIIDEAADAPQEILNSASMCLTGNSPNRIILLSTPHKEGLFTDLVREPHKFGYTLITYSSEVCPWLKETIERAKKTCSKQQYKIEIMAKIPELSELNYFPHTHLAKCVQPVECVRVFPESSLEAGIDWGFNEPTVLTITEKAGIKRKTIYQKTWKHQPIEILAPEIAKILKDFRMTDYPNITKADSQPKEYKGWVEKYYRDLHINYVLFQDHKSSMLEQLRRRISQHTIIIPTKLVDLVKQLRTYRSEMVKDDDLVISLALSCYEGHFESKPKRSMVVFGRMFDEDSWRAKEYY